ncbi:MAG: hypothetical protein U0Z44_07945 [Kouleothrix sp.]
MRAPRCWDGGGVTGAALVNELTDYVRFEIDLQGTRGTLRLAIDQFEIARAKRVSFEQARAETPDFEGVLEAAHRRRCQGLRRSPPPRASCSTRSRVAPRFHRPAPTAAPRSS